MVTETSAEASKSPSSAQGELASYCSELLNTAGMDTSSRKKCPFPPIRAKVARSTTTRVD